MKSLYSFLLLLLFTVPLRAQETMPLSLTQAVDLALKNAYSIKNARIDLQNQQAKNSEITGIALPQLNGSNQFTWNVRPVVSFLPAQILNPSAPAGSFLPVTFVPKFQNTASVSASQILFDGSVLVALQARKTLLQLFDLGIRASEEEVRFNVTKAYMTLVVARRQFGTLENTLRFFRKITADLQTMRTAGFVEKIDVDRSNVQLNNLATDSLRAFNQIDLAEQALKFAMGMRTDARIELTDTSLATTLPRAQELLANPFEYTNRQEYNQLQTQLRLNEFDIKRYRYKGLPSLALFGTAAYTYGSTTFSEIAKPSNYIFYALTGFQLNVPIFDGRQRSFQVKQAQLAAEKTRNNIANLELGLDLESSRSRSILRNNVLAVQTQERNLSLAREVLDLAEKKYKAGVGSNIEVTQAQTELQQAQNNYYASLLDVISASADLQRSLGQFK